MVEHRPLSDIIAYAILTLGIFIVAFPVYLALIASTHDAATVVGGNMPLRPAAIRWTTTTAPSSSADRAPSASRSAIC
jgi:ABC-type glycerol-3-phosphate transport system permease component